MITEKSFSIKLDVSRLAGAGLATLTDPQGHPVEGVFIPKDANYIVHGEKGGLYLNMRAYKMKELRPVGDGTFADTHVIKIQAPKNVYDSMSEEERMAFPIIGGVSCYVGDGSSGMMNYTGAATPRVDNPVQPMVAPAVSATPAVKEDDDDLPF